METPRLKKIPLYNIDWELTVEKDEASNQDGLFELHDFMADASVYIEQEDIPAIERALKAIKQYYKER